MAEALQLVFEPLPDADLERFIEDNVIAVNIAQTGVSEWHPFGYFLRNALGEWLGGCLGMVWGDWVNVRWLWVAQALRGQGNGARLLDAAERFGASHGATGATLETHSAQALGFYQKRGYKVFGTLEDYPPGHTKSYLRKNLSRTRR